jgi:diguanylate cyclase (GGDEF)-like protein/PAS domain S-box-containing protein
MTAKSDAAMRALLEGLPDATVGAGRDGLIAFVNERAEELFGYTREELMGRPIHVIWPERLRARYVRNMELYFSLEHPLRFTARAYGLRRDGTEFVGEMSWGIVDTDDGSLLLAVGRDISERLATERALRRHGDEQTAVAALGGRALSGVAPAELAREAAERVGMALSAELVLVAEPPGVGGGPAAVARWGAGDVPVTAIGDAGTAMRADGPVTVAGGWSVAIRTGEEIFGALSVYGPRVASEDVATEPAFLLAVANVLATAYARLRTDQQMRHLALHDPLTRLANRALCRDRIEQALAHSERSGSPAAVLYVDVDDFKQINDLYGHGTGDHVLVALARRLGATVRPGDTVARMGGDEFVVVCEGIDERIALALGHRVAAAIGEPLEVDGTAHRVSASVGIALAGADAPDADALLANADAASYRAKEAGRGRVEIFDERLRRSALARVRTEADLEGAVERGELKLALQPIVALADGAVVGREALLRWSRGGAGTVAPAEFIPVAEESGLITAIDAWVLEQACRLALRSDGWTSINLSARRLADPKLLEQLSATLAATGLAPHRLAVEVTESGVLEVTGSARRNLDEMKALGVRLVLDDFGIGHASLQHLRDIPVDIVKLDQTFVAGLAGEEGRGHAAIVGGVVHMGAALGIEVVAAGVEHERQADVLRELGCPLAQGFHFGRPEIVTPAPLGVV